MAVWITKHSAADIKGEAEQLGLEWRALVGVEVRTFDDGTAILVTHHTPDASKLTEQLVALGMIEPSG